MKRFSSLVQVLGTSTKTNAKITALQEYFATADPADKVWVIALFTGRRPRRSVTGAMIAFWCMELTGIPAWLFEESYHTTGDFAETVALLLPDPEGIDNGEEYPLRYYMDMFIQLANAEEHVKKEFITQSWKRLDRNQKFVFNKLITGGFRIGVSQKLIVNAIAKTSEVSPSIIAHRISGNWDPSVITFEELLSTEHMAADSSKPYPFYLAYALEDDPSILGDPAEWQAEWKWDGIRGQIIKRDNELFVWSRGEELMTEKFPEYNILSELLPGGVAIDGEIITLADGIASGEFAPLPFSSLQTRIGRKNITKKLLTLCLLT